MTKYVEHRPSNPISAALKGIASFVKEPILPLSAR